MGGRKKKFGGRGWRQDAGTKSFASLRCEGDWVSKSAGRDLTQRAQRKERGYLRRQDVGTEEGFFSRRAESGGGPHLADSVWKDVFFSGLCFGPGRSKVRPLHVLRERPASEGARKPGDVVVLRGETFGLKSSVAEGAPQNDNAFISGLSYGDGHFVQAFWSGGGGWLFAGEAGGGDGGGLG